MKTHKRYLLGWIILLLPFYIHAQQTGQLEIYMSPKNGLIKIDGKVIDFSIQNQPAKLELPTGEYIISAWSKNMGVKEKTVTVEANKTKSVRMNLQVSTQFEKYRKAQSKYFWTKTLRYTSYAAMTGISIATTTYAFNSGANQELDDAKTRMQEATRVYKAAVSAIEIESSATEYKNELIKYNSALDDVNKRKKIGIPLMVVSYGATIFHIFKSSRKKLVKPIYQEEDSPFSSIQLEPNMSYTQNDTSIGFSIKMKF